MMGQETVVVTMLTPKGVPLVQSLSFKEAEGFYEADITSLEVMTYISLQCLEVLRLQCLLTSTSLSGCDPNLGRW